MSTKTERATLTNKDIALALGYTVREEEHWFTLLRPNGKERWIGENPGMASTEEDAWNLFHPRTDLLAAMEIDDWLHGKGCATELRRSEDSEKIHYRIVSYNKPAMGVFRGQGIARPAAITAAFESYWEAALLQSQSATNQQGERHA